MNTNLLEFPVCIYGRLEPVNDVLSTARVRIFYKYENRNGTYITDEFADELIKSLPGVPVKGIYKDGDYTDHGEARNEGRVYGFVPENYDFAWEPFEDIDGVTRTYACCKVFLFTALYPEASEIVDKGQSMELYAPTLKYHQAFIKGSKWIVFDHGCFLGLQVLGNKVEPCFEGASFYTLQKQIEDTIQKIKEYSNIGGKTGMPALNFKLSDGQKFDALWQLLNTTYDEEHNWEITYGICEIYDNYAVVCNYADNTFERVYYVKNDEEDSLAITGRERCFIIDVTEQEKTTLEALQALNGDTYEAVSDTLTNAKENENKCAELCTKIDELNGSIATLTTETENAQNSLNEFKAQYDAVQAQLAESSTELDSLRTYKHNIETQQKETVIAEYNNQLSEEIISTYRANLDNYTVEDLDMHLAYELKKSGSFKNFEKLPNIPKDTPQGGINEILARYKK